MKLSFCNHGSRAKLRHNSLINWSNQCIFFSRASSIHILSRSNNTSSHRLGMQQKSKILRIHEKNCTIHPYWTVFSKLHHWWQLCHTLLRRGNIRGHVVAVVHNSWTWWSAAHLPKFLFCNGLFQTNFSTMFLCHFSCVPTLELQLGTNSRLSSSSSPA